jgi:hypothetical protein
LGVGLSYFRLVFALPDNRAGDGTQLNFPGSERLESKVIFAARKNLRPILPKLQMVRKTNDRNFFLAAANKLARIDQ